MKPETLSITFINIRLPKNLARGLFITLLTILLQCGILGISILLRLDRNYTETSDTQATQENVLTDEGSDNAEQVSESGMRSGSGAHMVQYTNHRPSEDAIQEK